MDKFGIQRRTPKSGGMLKSRIYEYNDDFFENIDTEEKAYFLGFILADGCVVDKPKSKCLKIGIHPKDIDVLEKFLLAINAEQKVKLTQKKDKRYGDRLFESAMVTINSTKMCDDLIKLGVVPRKSLKKTFPSIPDHLNRHMTRGFFDGDGCLSMYNRSDRDRLCASIGFYSWKDCLHPLRKVIFEQTNVLLQPKIRDHYGTHSMTYSSIKDVVDIINWMYNNSTVWMERKYNLAKKLLDEDIVRALGKPKEVGRDDLPLLKKAE